MTVLPIRFQSPGGEESPKRTRPADHAVAPDAAGKKVWLVSANMGYGHLRAAVPLKPIAHEGIITLGENDGSTPGERRLWNKFQGLYSRFSRAKGIPVIGKYIFKILDRFQYIPSFYPVRNLSKSTFQVSLLSSLIDKGLCAGLLGTMERNPFPLVTSFYAPAIAAEMRGTQPVY